MTSARTAATAARPLIVRIRNWVGDVVLGLPALRLIESHGYELHIVARGPWAPALFAGYGWPVHVQPKTLRERIAQLKSLRAESLRRDPGFDRRENAIVLPHSFSSALEMRLAGLRAVGYGQEARSFLLARSERITYGGHALISYWELGCRFLRVEGKPPALIDLPLEPAKVAEAERLLAAHGVGPGYVLVCPFAGGMATSKKLNKKWPQFTDWVRTAKPRLGRPLVVYPGPGEHDLARELYPDAVMLEGSDIGVYGGLLQRAALVVSNDTGPAHMAAALGRPLLMVLAPTPPEQWAPWGPRVHVMRKPQPAEGSVWPEVEEVMAQAERMLSAGPAATA
jgi:ADP-heptose:LPS heptosyltransferase